MQTRYLNQDTGIIDIPNEFVNVKNIKELEESFDGLINQHIYDVLLNMLNVKEVDNHFFDLVFNVYEKLKRKSGSLDVYGLNSDLLIFMYILKYDKIIGLYHNEEDAIKRKNLMVRRHFKVV